MITREEALSLLRQYVKNENLIKHCYTVEAGMFAYAKKYCEDEELWRITGLLHDIDYEEFPQEHPSENTRKWLSTVDVPEDLIYAIESHGTRNDKQRNSRMDKALHAVDSVSGIIIAAALVRPDKMETLDVKSVNKKIKDKSFAAKMDRSRMQTGCDELGITLDEHLKLMIDAIKSIRGELGL